MDIQSSAITVNRRVEKVWQDWTTPADIMQWIIPFDNWHSAMVENELKSGGCFLFRMEAKDGNGGFDNRSPAKCK